MGAVSKGTEGRCLSCKSYGSYDNREYCKNKLRLALERIDNCWFSPRFDGNDCDYYEYG